MWKMLGKYKYCTSLVRILMAAKLMSADASAICRHLPNRRWPAAQRHVGANAAEELLKYLGR